MPAVKDQYLVFDPEDRLFNSCLCHGEEEAREVVAQFGSTTCLRVRRITEGDLARDVTADFIDDEQPDEWAGTSYDRAASAADLINDIRRDLRDILEAS
jgi:hypothetical protein